MLQLLWKYLLLESTPSFIWVHPMADYIFGIIVILLAVRFCHSYKKLVISHLILIKHRKLKIKMPRLSKKSVFIEKIFQYGMTEMMELGSENKSECEEIQNEVESCIVQAYQSRFGEIIRVPKQSTWLAEVLPSYDEGRFRQATRVNYATFHKILKLIEINPIFHDQNKLQFPVSVQLAIALYRFGTSGTAASVHNVANLFGVGDGSTVLRVTRRVTSAILKLKNQFVFWPNVEERLLLEEKSKYTLPGCVGVMDGTHVKLDEAPINDSESYFDKNRNYSIQVQIICDVNTNIQNYVAGYPGSCHDSRVWNECSISHNLNEYFSNDQYVAADKGYPLTKYVVTPFRDNTRDVSRRESKKFNKYFSSVRVIIEHVNGMLKETFGSLKELRIKIKNKNGHQEAVDWISACIILYNIIQPCDGKDAYENKFTNLQEFADVAEGNDKMNEVGKLKRICISNWVNENK